MFILGNIISGIARVLDMALGIYVWIIIIAALITWVSPDPFNPIVRTLRGLTEPLFRAIRRKLPVSAGGIDFSPIAAILLVYLTKWVLVRTLFDLADRLR